MEADDGAEGVVTVADLVEALGEVRPALGKQDEVLKARYPMGISPCSSSMKRVQRDLDRFISPAPISDAKRRHLFLAFFFSGFFHFFEKNLVILQNPRQYRNYDL